MFTVVENVGWDTVSRAGLGSQLLNPRSQVLLLSGLATDAAGSAHDASCLAASASKIVRRFTHAKIGSQLVLD